MPRLRGREYYKQHRTSQPDQGLSVGIAFTQFPPGNGCLIRVHQFGQAFLRQLSLATQFFEGGEVEYPCLYFIPVKHLTLRGLSRRI